MGARIFQENYKGKKIYIHDFHGMSGEELLRDIPLLAKETLSKTDKAQLIVFDVTDGKASPKAVLAFKKAAADIRPVTKKAAIIGVTSLQKILLNSVNLISSLGAKPFDSMQEAKDWLIRE